MILMTGF